MKNDKRKNQTKGSPKKMAAHLEESLREKLFELVRGLGHDVVDVSEEIIKMSKRLTRKLSKTMKNVLTPGGEDSTTDSTEVKATKSSNSNKKKKKGNKSEAAQKEKGKKDKQISSGNFVAQKDVAIKSNVAKSQGIPSAKNATVGSTKSSSNKLKTSPQGNQKPSGPKLNVAQKIETPIKTAKKLGSMIKNTSDTVKKTLDKKVLAPVAKKVSRRNSTIGANAKKAIIELKKSDVAGSEPPKRKPGRPASTVKVEKNEDASKVEKKIATNKSTVVRKPKAAPTSKK
ncbi:hypothetical protein ACVWYG_000522 [Pedobacter sp. UYEF25]